MRPNNRPKWSEECLELIMQSFTSNPEGFIDRRQTGRGDETRTGAERRQFSDSRNSSRPEVDELAKAVDQYKLRHRRRFITFEELFDVMVSLGYHK